MARVLVRNKSAHQQAIRTTYFVLAAGLVLVVGINLVAYWMFLLINDHYRQQDRALVNCELKLTDANMLFQKIMADESGESAVGDLNAVWTILREAREQAEVVTMRGVGQGILDRIDAYRRALLTTNSAFRKADSGPAIDAVTPAEGSSSNELSDSDLAVMVNQDPAVCWVHAQELYAGLKAELNAVELIFATTMRQKMMVVQGLYGMLFVVVVALFGVLLYSMRAYITERHRAEAMLTESRDSLAAIFDSLSSVLLVVDPKGTVLQCNQAAIRYLGLDRETCCGANLWSIVPWLLRYQQSLATVFYSGQPLELYRERLSIADTERAFNLSFHAVPSLAGVVLRLDDVTMQEIQEVHARQTQQMHLLRNLVRSLANDFNNVLGAIGGTLSLMRFAIPEAMRAEGSPELTEHFATMESAMERAAIMVRQMSSLAGEAELSLQPLDVGEQLRHVLNVVRNNLPQGIQLRAEMPRGRALAKAHPRLLEQIMVNLVDNAVAAIVEAQPSGGAPQSELITVQLDEVVPDHAFRLRQPQAQAASYLVIHVGDSGPGMTPEVAARIFEPFFTTRTSARSAGLGLSLVNEIVERLGGFVEVRSSRGQGTIFSVYLPELAEATEFLAREATVAEGTPAAVKDGIPLGSGLVLVVDDEPVMRKTATNILTKLGYEVVVAEGGREALEIFRLRHAEVAMVMLDLAMPEMGGKETFLAMREIDPTVPALMASGYQQDELVDEALKIGIAGFIRKPYRLSTLAQEIDRIRRQAPA